MNEVYAAVSYNGSGYLERLPVGAIVLCKDTDMPQFYKKDCLYEVVMYNNTMKCVAEYGVKNATIYTGQGADWGLPRIVGIKLEDYL